jgi:hypothetical protein
MQFEFATDEDQPSGAGTVTQLLGEAYATVKGLYDRLGEVETLNAALEGMEVLEDTVASMVPGNQIDIVVPDRVALATLDQDTQSLAYLNEDDQAGHFKWYSDVLVDEVVADPEQENYVPPASDITGLSGAWVRQTIGKTQLAASTGASLVNTIASGIGAVVRSLADWFADEHSVMSYLSLSERVKIRLRNTTAADKAIHTAAFNSACIARSGVLKVPKGLYYIDPDVSIDMADNILLKGEGLVSEIRAAPSANATYEIFRPTGLTNIGFEDLLIVGEREEHLTSGTGYVTGDVVNVISALAGAGMRATVTAVNGRIQRLDIDPANPGANYVNAEAVTFTANTGVGLGGSGTIMSRSVKTWVEGMTYVAKDFFVKDSGNTYVCAVTHVAGEAFADDLLDGKWTLVNAGLEQAMVPYMGEGGRGIGIFQCLGVTVRRVAVRNCWGDGIYVGGDGPGQCEDVLIEDCDADGNRRQGITIAAAKRWKIIRSLARNTWGALPSAGINIEPNTNIGDADVEDGSIEGNVLTGNYGPGLAVSLNKVKKLNVRDVKSYDNTGSGGYFAGLGEGFELDGGVWGSLAEHGLYFSGAQTMPFEGGIAKAPYVLDTPLDGIVIRYNMTGFQLLSPRVRRAGTNGIRVEGASIAVTDILVSGGDIRESSQNVDNTHSNVWIGKQTPFLNITNKLVVRAGGLPNQPRFGIRVNENEAINIENCDVYTGGNESNIGSEVAANDFATTSGALPNVKLRNNLGFKTEGRWNLPNVAISATGYFSTNIPIALDYMPQFTDFQVSFCDPAGVQATVIGYPRNVTLTKTNLNVRVRVSEAGVADSVYTMVVDARRPSIL